MGTVIQENNYKTVLITGASSGIGLELSRLFADDGYRLIMVARESKKLKEAAGELQLKYVVPINTIVKDLSDPNAPSEIFNQLQKEHITVDVLVNNAGFGTYGNFSETELEDELKMIQVNVVALMHLTKLFLKEMVKRKSGKIMNVASTAAFQPGPMMASYYATKAFVLSFSEAISSELRRTGVTLTALCPGPTASGFQKRAKMERSRFGRKKMMDAEIVAQLGYKAMMKGKTLVIAGLKNKVLAKAVRITPRKMVTAIVRTLNT
ncbi:MAG: SDR family oxidoreductase [Ignavibacteria bacterium]|nr:SDR family oxidoreductase [Ignavibacteria bacterium]